MRVEDFDYDLPGELIAQRPSKERGSSRLLHLDGASGAIADCLFSDLPRFVRDGDLIILNDTRVVKARLLGNKDSGGRVEVIIDQILEPRRALALIRASHAPKAGQLIYFGAGSQIRVAGRCNDLFELEFEKDVLSVLEEHGRVPLPPYIEREPDIDDEYRYQTVFASEPGAVAAPTAGLHFDDNMLVRLRSAGAHIGFVTLHVGSGTFQPVRVTEIEQHVMHSEWYRIPEATARAVGQARSTGRRVLAVGTTSLRALESGAQEGSLRPGSGWTRLFINPGYRFRVVDRLLTNFHLPRSTLLMLVAAFAGLKNARCAYEHAVEQQYRFFSYGDAMLIERMPAQQ